MIKRRVLIAAIGLSLLAPHASAWPESLMHCLARDARRLVPKTLNRLIGEREEEIFEAARRFPPELLLALATDQNRGRLCEQTLEQLQGHLASVTTLVNEKRISEALVVLGASFRVPAELADPVLASGPPGYPPGVAREYYAFVERSLPKIPVVIEDRAALRLDAGELPRYWQGILERSRSHSHVITEELWKRGRLVDQRTLDFRSPAFGVGSIAYSRAVNAIAATWIAVWREANGDTTRMPEPLEVKPR